MTPMLRSRLSLDQRRKQVLMIMVMKHEKDLLPGVSGDAPRAMCLALRHPRGLLSLKSRPWIWYLVCLGVSLPRHLPLLVLRRWDLINVVKQRSCRGRSQLSEEELDAVGREHGHSRNIGRGM